MTVLLAFSLTLLVAILISERASQSSLSIPVLFVLAGFAIGPGVMDFIQLEPDNEGVILFVELALFAVLLVDGMHLGLPELESIWQLPGRVLLIGLPLTLALTAVVAHFVLNVNWLHALLIAAILSPTDPIFASALVTRKDVPELLQRLLNVESGVNDGLALPIVLTILAMIGVEKFQLPVWLLEVVWGVILGVVVPWVIFRLEGSRIFSAVHIYTSLLVITIGMLLFALARLFQANIFLTAFTAGISIATLNPDLRDVFKPLGEVVAEMLKLGALLILGALLSVRFLEALSWRDVVFALSVLLLARPFSVFLALRNSRMSMQARLAAAWFGPRGFASVVYGLMLFTSGVSEAAALFRIVSTVIIISILAHSTTDVLVARWIRVEEEEGNVEEPEPEPEPEPG